MKPKHILIPTHVEVEILQRAHTAGVTTVSCPWTVRVDSVIQSAADTQVWTESETVCELFQKDKWAEL